MTKPKKKPTKMGRTLVVIDEETKALWTKQADKEGRSRSSYLRVMIKEKEIKSKGENK